MPRQKKQATELHHLLMQCFPKAFPPNYSDILPLKLGIERDILIRLTAQGEPVDPDLLHRVLANHTGRAGYQLALLHRPGGYRYDLDGDPVGAVDALARREAICLLAKHQQRQQAISARHKRHNTLEKKQQAAKRARVAEQARLAAEKQQRREENERNRLKNLERKTVAARLRATPDQPDAAPALPPVTFRKRRRIDPP